MRLDGPSRTPTRVPVSDKCARLATVRLAPGCAAHLSADALTLVLHALDLCLLLSEGLLEADVAAARAQPTVSNASANVLGLYCHACDGRAAVPRQARESSHASA
eukprot:scaffold121496_cov75-Phaeocystis_antarctica.AAC.2